MSFKFKLNIANGSKRLEAHVSCYLTAAVFFFCPPLPNKLGKTTMLLDSFYGDMPFVLASEKLDWTHKHCQVTIHKIKILLILTSKLNLLKTRTKDLLQHWHINAKAKWNQRLKPHFTTQTDQAVQTQGNLLYKLSAPEALNEPSGNTQKTP